ncbi:MAG TPA: CBS and ACT domain-containing protein [Methylomirabilota bacterium]|nr:CBS and ACT domain-containing protein [Methylomirabilota bacterium]
MFVEKWMTPDPFTLSPDAPISVAAMEMGRRKFRHIPVAESASNGRFLVGIVSKYDVARAFPPNLNPFSVEVFRDSVPRPVSAIMTNRVVTTTPDCPIEDVARILRSNKIGALPVLRENRLVGIITQSDLCDALMHTTASQNGGVRLVVESETGANAIPSVIHLSGQHGVNIVSMMSFPDNQAKGKDLSVFRFGSEVPPGFIEAIWSHGFRVLNAVNQPEMAKK